MFKSALWVFQAEDFTDMIYQVVFGAQYNTSCPLSKDNY